MRTVTKRTFQPNTVAEAQARLPRPDEDQGGQERSSRLAGPRAVPGSLPRLGSAMIRLHSCDPRRDFHRLRAEGERSGERDDRCAQVVRSETTRLGLAASGSAGRSIRNRLKRRLRAASGR